MIKIVLRQFFYFLRHESPQRTILKNDMNHSRELFLKMTQMQYIKIISYYIDRDHFQNFIMISLSITKFLKDGLQQQIYFVLSK